MIALCKWRRGGIECVLVRRTSGGLVVKRMNLRQQKSRGWRYHCISGGPTTDSQYGKPVDLVAVACTQGGWRGYDRRMEGRKGKGRMHARKKAGCTAGRAPSIGTLCRSGVKGVSRCRTRGGAPPPGSWGIIRLEDARGDPHHVSLWDVLCSCHPQEYC